MTGGEKTGFIRLAYQSRHPRKGRIPSHITGKQADREGTCQGEKTFNYTFCRHLFPDMVFDTGEYIIS